MIFSEDIHNRIRIDFPNKEEAKEVEALLKRIVESGLNVGEGQFVRSVIFLANKNKEKLEQILNECDDPRDVLHEAEIESGSLDHWFAIPFDEIKQLNGNKYSGDIFKDTPTTKDDGLPF